MLDTFLKFLFLFGFIAAGIFIVYMHDKRQKQWKQAAYKIALSFGCIDGVKRKTWSEDQESYEWERDGIKYMVTGGAHTALMGVSHTVVTQGAVYVTYPRPLPFQLSICQGSSKLTGDPNFDRSCRVQSDQLEMAKLFLQDPDLRTSIRTLVKSMVRIVEINQEGISAKFFDVKEFEKQALETIELGNRLWATAEKLYG